MGEQSKEPFSSNHAIFCIFCIISRPLSRRNWLFRTYEIQNFQTFVSKGKCIFGSPPKKLLRIKRHCYIYILLNFKMSDYIEMYYFVISVFERRDSDNYFALYSQYIVSSIKMEYGISYIVAINNGRSI